MTLIRYTRDCIDAAMGRLAPSSPGSSRVGIRVFESWTLENIFGKAHPITPIFWFGPPIAYGLYRSALIGFASLPLLVVGWLLWSLIEYVLHRFVFHHVPSSGTEKAKLQAFLMHGYHHDFPRDPYRLVAPPLMSWPIGIILWLAYSNGLGERLAWPVFAGTCIGYVAYDWIHYYTHHFKPGNPVGKWLRAYHLQHHHGDGQNRFGVSSPLWDFVLGTYQPLKRASRP